MAPVNCNWEFLVLAVLLLQVQVLVYVFKAVEDAASWKFVVGVHFLCLSDKFCVFFLLLEHQVEPCD